MEPNDLKKEEVVEEVHEQPVVDTDQHKDEKKKKRIVWTTRFMARIGIFTAIATVLYLIPFPPFSFPIFPAYSFLEVHFDDVPALIAGFAYGPLTGFIVVFIKTAIKLLTTKTAAIGELADLIFSASYVVSAAFVYKQNRTFKGAILAIVMATFVQIAVSTIGNLYFIVDAYANLFGITLDKADYLVYLIPFNAIKDVLVAVVTLLSYKSVHKLMKKISL